MGDKRFALPSQQVTELAMPDRLHRFPHTTPLLAGVLVRRGNIIPVCDIADVLVGAETPSRKFFLIATRGHGHSAECIAIPVTGECELAKAQVVPPVDGGPAFVTGALNFRGEDIEIVDIDRLISEYAAKAATAVRARGVEVPA